MTVHPCIPRLKKTCFSSAATHISCVIYVNLTPGAVWPSKAKRRQTKWASAQLELAVPSTGDEQKHRSRLPITHTHTHTERHAAAHGAANWEKESWIELSCMWNIQKENRLKVTLKLRQRSNKILPHLFHARPITPSVFLSVLLFFLNLAMEVSKHNKNEEN